MAITIGRPEEWAEFERRNARFFAVWPELQRLIEAVFNRTFSTDTPAERVIYTLGRGAIEEFMEVLLTAGNGYGVAGLKLLRGMFERVVTCLYLIAHPDKVDDFLDYHHIHVRRVVNHLQTSGVDVKRKYTDAQLKEVEENYQRVRGRYQEACRECGATRDRPTWDLDLASMARDVGVERMYAGLAFWPTMLLHTTVFSMENRLEGTPEAVAFKPGAQRKEADAALVGAHVCLSLLLERQVAYFRLEVPREKIHAVLERAWPV